MRKTVSPASIARQKSEHAQQPKVIEASEKAVLAIPFDTGAWKIDGTAGLYVRARKASRTFFLQRRVDGELVRRTLTATTVKAAKDEASREWTKIKPTPAAKPAETLGAAIDEYLAAKDLSESTRRGYKYVADTYLGSSWLKRNLHDIGNDRLGVRRLQGLLTRDGSFPARPSASPRKGKKTDKRKGSKATANQVIRLLSAVYNWARSVDDSLPECPTIATPVFRIKARNWAMGTDELKAWSVAVEKLSAVKNMWWWTLLMTGARRESVAALRWKDINFERKMIRFEIDVKGDRTYAIPAADKLVALLIAYRDSGKVPPSEWVFPSDHIPGHHIVRPRNDEQGVLSPHHLRHTYRTTLSELSATGEQARMLMGHATVGVNEAYITSALVLESLRPVSNAAAEKLIQACK